MLIYIRIITEHTIIILTRFTVFRPFFGVGSGQMTSLQVSSHHYIICNAHNIIYKAGTFKKISKQKLEYLRICFITQTYHPTTHNAQHKHDTEKNMTN